MGVPRGGGRAADRIGAWPEPAVLAPGRRRGSKSPSWHGLTTVAGLMVALLAPAILARSASQAALTIRVGPTAALPKNSFVRVRGLPPMVSLSEGYATAAPGP